MKRSPSYQTFTVPGFKFSGISAGIKKAGEKDLALIFSETTAVIAGVFTTNRIKAAPVRLSIDRIASQKGQAIVINSGNANACTGRQGLKDAQEMAERVAEGLGISPDLVHVSSTGVIGRQLPMKRIKKAIPEAIRMLSPYSIGDAASAIMTTDTFEKIASTRIKIAGRTGTIAGIAKGAGMICPNMATMLCFIVTDIAVRPGALDSALREAVKRSFNRLMIDNDRSTNDTVLIMANGMLDNKPIGKNSPFYLKFEDALSEVTYSLSRMIASDGEGATKLIEVIVKGAKTEADAEKVARAIAGSMLVRTAIHGNDPNWGRIMAAIGYSGVDVIEQNIDIYLNRCKLVSRGKGMKREGIARRSLARKEVIITVDLRIGRKSAKILTCDLTEEYVKINATYTT